jgi:cytochrome P450
VTRLPPGPKGTPLLGTLSALRDPIAFLNDLGRNYGDVSHTRIALTHVYMLNHPDLIEQVLVGKYRDFVKDWGTQQLVGLVGRGLLTSEGELWKRQRRLAAPPLSATHIAKYATTMVECTERDIASWQEGRRDIHVDMMRLTLEIVGKTLLGVDTSHDAERITHIVEVAMAYFDKQFWTWHGALPAWIPTRERRAFAKAVRELDGIIYPIIARCRAESRDADFLLARLVQARDEDGAAMSDEQLRDEAVTMLLAGHETTALALSYAIYLLGKHPAAMERARTEVDAQLADRSATVEDVRKLPFIDAVIRESLRLYPPAYSVGRQSLRELELGGHVIPKGVQVSMSPYIVQRDPRFFDDPDAFRPERWLAPEADALPRFAYFPFGGGPRVCNGNRFAMMEAVLVLATMLQRLELTIEPEFNLQFMPSVTLRPKGEVPVTARQRPRPTSS